MATETRTDAQVGIPCSFYRGGTSRGMLLRRQDLPFERQVIERILLKICGSPDPRQIDGIGAGSSQTSKVMLVGPGNGIDHDVQMTFAQVAVDVPTVDWGGNCGNMTSAVGPFAIESGFIAAVEPVTVVRILSLNTGARVNVHVPVRRGRVVTEGDYAITGVTGTGARILIEWLNPAGTINGSALPTGRVRETMRLADGRSIEVSVVDAANPVVFCRAGGLGLTGLESPDELMRRSDILAVLEELRSIGAERLGLVPSRADATRISPGLPKVAYVAPPADYVTTGGARVAAASHDVQGRLMAMQAPHRSYAVSAAICTAAAAAIPGTIVHDSVSSGARGRSLRIAHPFGVLEVSVEAVFDGPIPRLVAGCIGRTARLIMSGHAFVPEAWIAEAPRVDPNLSLVNEPAGQRPVPETEES